MFDIDGGWRRAFVWWKREASITSRAETLTRMRVPMHSLRRWNQTGRGQRFPSFTIRRKGKLFTPFFPPYWSVWLQTVLAHTQEMQLLIFSVSPHPPALPHLQSLLWQVNLQRGLKFPLKSSKKKLSESTRWFSSPFYCITAVHTSQFLVFLV